MIGANRKVTLQQLSVHNEYESVFDNGLIVNCLTQNCVEDHYFAISSKDTLGILTSTSTYHFSR
jgi:hypothetical protein